MKHFLPIVILLLGGIVYTANSQSNISFTSSLVAGANLQNPTTLAFGPDNKLYVTQQDGTIYGYTIQKNGPNDYQIIDTDVILLVKNIPNRNDRGEIIPTLNTRQITGILTAGTSTNPILYICSSDPRIGGGGELGDLDLDTNSGTISKLTKNGSTWTMVDLVRGLPRSEENHAPNGMVLDEVNNILYVAQGGNTNAGSPSNNFAYLTEYALAAAVLKIDLNQINNQFGGSYTLPTLDDPTRPNNPDGSDLNDPYGGNDGLNQAKLIIGGPVQIYSPGYRNIYDLVLTKTPGKAGRMYTIDNGANGGWGGYPENEGTPNVTNNRILSEPGSTSPTLTDDKVNNLDNLHFITGQGYYGGHPNPIRANPGGAGLYWFDNQTEQGHFEMNPTVDWPPVPVSLANPVESDFRNPGVNDGALLTFPYSTNGMTEYTSSMFNGAMAGDLLACSFGGPIYRIQLNDQGNVVTNLSDIFTGFGIAPLDIIAQGDGDIYAGSVWVITYGNGDIVVFEPNSTPGTCTGDNDNFNLDDDADGYSNADETQNGTDPCSPASKPNDFDLDLVSDLNDTDDDNDGISDINDKFALDIANGRNTVIPLDYPFLNASPGFGLFGVGHTGLMTNYVDNYADHFDLLDPALIVGGAVGVLSVPAQPGDATSNNQDYAFQFGIPMSPSLATFTLQSRMLGAPFFNGANGSGLGTQSQGIYFGNGDQDNYFKVVLHANEGNPGFQILAENNGAIVSQQIFPVSGILSESQIDLFLEVNVVTGAVKCSYQTIGLANPVEIGQFNATGTLLSLLQNPNGAVALGVISSCGNKTPFSASWDYFKITNTSLSNTPPVVVQAYPDQSVPSTQSSLVLQLNQIFNDDGGVNNLTFTVPNNTNAALISNTQIVGTQLTFTLSGATGTGNITLRATDGSGLFVEDVFQLTVTSEDTPQLVNIVRINSGGGEQNFGGEAWIADQYFTGGTVYSTAAGISNTTQDPIYQTERYGNFSYAIPVPGAGMYAVDLHFAEIYFNTPGSRIFNINIENGQFVRSNLDLIQTIGSINQAYVLRADNLNITDGTINITFTTVTDNAKISGIAVGRYDSAPVNTAPVVVQAYPDQSVPSTQSSLVVQLNQIFNDDGGVNNLTFTVPNNTNAALISNTQIVGTQLTFTLSGATGTGNITLRATDGSGLFVEDVFQLTVTSGGTPQLVNVVRINSGGGAQNFGGEAWIADQYFTGGTPYSTAAAISNTTQDPIYQTERYGNFSYAIPVPGAGMYAVDLHFAEIYFNTAGSRIFNINIENGQFVRTNLDLIQTIGSINQAYVLRADNLNITDGIINITLTTVTDNAKISGIAVGRYDSAPVNTAPVVVQAYPDQSVPSTQSSLVVQLNQIFNDDGGVNNLTFTVPNNTNAALISNTQIVGTQLTFTLSGATGTGNITLRATDGSGLFVEDVFQLTVAPEGSMTFYRAINLNGAALTIDGNSWQASSGAPNFSMTQTGGGTFANQAVPLVPATDANRATMIRSSIYGNVTLNVTSVPSGTYDVYLYVWEDNFAATYSVSLEGSVVQSNYNSGSAGSWSRLGPYRRQITDGAINVTTNGGDANLSGIEIWSLSGSPVNTPPVVVQAYPDQSVPSTQSSLVLQLNQIFNDDGGVNNLTFTVPNNTNAALISNTQIVGTQLTFTLSGATGTGNITLRATDGSGLFVEDVFQLTVTSGGTPQLVNVVRINAGGGAQNFGGEAWIADQYFTGGTAYATAAGISNTTQDAIYQTERFGNFSYAIPVPGAGTYAVDLHLAEIYFNTAGSRIFNINIENGQFVRTNLDLIQTIGSINQAYVLRADNLNITDGTINITLTTVTDNAKISGIAVSQYSTGAGSRAAMVSRAPIVEIPANILLHEGESWTYQVVASDPDGDELSYSSRNLPASLYIDKTTGKISGTIEVNALNKATYPVTLRVTDRSGLSTDVNFTVTIAAAKPLLSNADEEQFVVYPNPTDKDEFAVRIESKQQDRWNFALLDFTGKQIPLGSFSLEEGFHELSFDLSPHNLSSGLYYLAVQNSQGKKVIKVGIKLRSFKP